MRVLPSSHVSIQNSSPKRVKLEAQIQPGDTVTIRGSEPAPKSRLGRVARKAFQTTRSNLETVGVLAGGVAGALGTMAAVGSIAAASALPVLGIPLAIAGGAAGLIVGAKAAPDVVRTAMNAVARESGKLAEKVGLSKEVGSVAAVAAGIGLASTVPIIGPAAAFGISVATGAGALYGLATGNT